MGLFSFIKNAGAEIFGIGKTDAEIAAEELKEEEVVAQHLETTIKNLQLIVVDLSISIDDDIVVISGIANDQSTREKVILVAGNSKGIATVDDRMTVRVAPVAQFYTVVSGDTLGKIAKTYYGDAMKYPEIFEANKPMLKSPDLIYPGQVLRIPILD